MAQGRVCVVGVFVADIAFSASRLPRIGESFRGSSYAIGPGGKGSNQAVAAALAGAKVDFVTKLGADDFAKMAREKWAEVGVGDHSVSAAMQTGAAMIFVDERSAANAIILVAGSADALGVDDVEAKRERIVAADVVMTQLEQPAATALQTLTLAKEGGATTVFNPAPAPAPIDPAFFPLCDYVTPNEVEAEGLTGVKVTNLEEARQAAAALLELGAANALLTLGERGALLHNRAGSQLYPALEVDKVVDTTGAGDAFNGAFGAALAAGADAATAVRRANVAAGISVTRRGTAPAMPTAAEIDAKLG